MRDDDTSRYPVNELDSLPADLRERIAPVADKSGFVPNVFRGFGYRPVELRAFMDYHDALMEKSEGLSKAERELVVVATSGANRCLYCVVAHGAILRVRAKDPHIADQVATNPYQAKLSPRHRSIVDLALALTREPEHFSQSDIDTARQRGLSDDEIWDVAAITAFFAMSNRMAQFLALRPNDEFYTMGRQSRS